MAGPPSLIVGTTSNYTFIYKGWFSVWMPAPTDPTFFAFAAYASSNPNQPVTPSYTLAVKNDDLSNPLLTNPVDYQQLWVDPPLNMVFGDSQPAQRVGIWAPVPKDNYVALGSLATAVPFSSNPLVPPPKPALTAVKCLRSDYALTAQFGGSVYSGGGYANPDLCVMQIAQTLSMFAALGGCPPSGPVFVPKGLPSLPLAEKGAKQTRTKA